MRFRRHPGTMNCALIPSLSQPESGPWPCRAFQTMKARNTRIYLAFQNIEDSPLDFVNLSEEIYWLSGPLDCASEPGREGGQYKCAGELGGIPYNITFTPPVKPRLLPRLEYKLGEDTQGHTAGWLDPMKYGSAQDHKAGLLTIVPNWDNIYISLAWGDSAGDVGSRVPLFSRRRPLNRGLKPRPGDLPGDARRSRTLTGMQPQTRPYARLKIPKLFRDALQPCPIATQQENLKTDVGKVGNKIPEGTVYLSFFTHLFIVTHNIVISSILFSNISFSDFEDLPLKGKTTLAKEVYNHESILRGFDVRAWATVSQQHNIKEILQTLLKSTIKMDDTVKTEVEAELADMLQKSLKRKRYLIVLDDIWSCEVWDGVRRCFPTDENAGSRILLTTRNNEVARNAGTENLSMQMNFMDQDESWNLFKSTAFSNEALSSLFETIAKQIAEKCHGLPLTIVVVAGLLKSKMTIEDWGSVAKDVTSFITNDPDEQCSHVLGFSYIT
ncbi:hypothetical protein T459_35137 [Capsicum annuum]|uniref:NB-ARC domain-containing protein n=1 Tax=Capsicum annuum TaxID=4072 RepID=A0A2G2XU48_CAPAN|nr:hypothetical protein T459_35137 [Capsicum annuum]